MSEINVAALYIVATPIGNLSDMSQRAIETLQTVDVIAAEDTRHSGILLQHFAIKTPSVSLHDHNELQRSELLLTRLQQGESVALISDAGTPLISDPGYKLVSLVREHGIKVIPIPGSCAVIAALSASGLASDRFTFEGFLPPKQGARQQTLQALVDENRTMIFYDAPRRIEGTLADMVESFGGERKACIAREVTKLHETITTKPLNELLAWVADDSNQLKGECVVLVEGAKHHKDSSETEINRVLALLLKELPVKKAAAITSSLLEVSKNTAYDMALKLQNKD
ncbi:MAG: 16S rRNA (cytidine(1402)-2'-O)-methyltransferase [Gammaproteobacteria bacterium]|nr:16S rRNA (cytidine(1402)-2'-O)-methyltransferase [Gammaproteobacteria bacterium]